MEEETMSFDHDRIVRTAGPKAGAVLKGSLMRAIVATLLMVFAAGPAFASAGIAPNPVTSEESAQQPKTATTPKPTDEDGQRYAAREQAAQGLENFKGGDGFGIYIGSGVLLVALLVVIAVLVL
jgi:hypothetical protein